MLDDLGSLLTHANMYSVPAHVLIKSILSQLQKEPTGLIHPHGFFIFPLLRSSTEEWRLHIWPRGPRIISGMPSFIHTHDVDIDSRILHGELTNITYNVSETSDEGLPLYEVSYEGDKYSRTTSNTLHKTNLRVQVRPLSRTLIKCNELYHIHRHTYHEAVVADEMITSTLVRMHSRSAGKVKVVGLDGHPDVISFKRSYCDISEMIDVLTIG